MNMNHFNKSLLSIGLLGIFGLSPALAMDRSSVGFVGKNNWLFYRVELSEPSDEPLVGANIDLISRFSRQLKRNGVQMAIVMVPIKMRTYADYLPEDEPLTPYMQGNYDRLLKMLRASEVKAVDVNRAFLTKQYTEFPYFFRLDTHWSPSGALVAAESVRTGIDGDVQLKSILKSIPIDEYELSQESRGVKTSARGLIPLLSNSSTQFDDEKVLPFKVKRKGASRDSLLGNTATPGIALMGSSYSASWTMFPQALRYALQRDILAVSVEAIQGSWVGMEMYLRDDSFQSNKPKLLIWEIPERDMRMPPDYKYRARRYQSDNTEWLLRASAWVQNTCLPASAIATFETGSAFTLGADGVVSKSVTSADDYFEISFSQPLNKLDYLAANISLFNSNKVVLEATAAGGERRKFEVPIAGDGVWHKLRSPLPAQSDGFSKVRIFPGHGTEFKLKNMQVCRQPGDLLE